MRNIFYWIALVILFTACKKSGGNEGPGTGPGTGPGNNGTYSYGTGTIYYRWATEGVLKVDLKTAERGQALRYNTSRNGWDISRDGTMLIVAEDAPGDYDAEMYTITNLSDGTVISKFRKASGYGNSTYPSLSPDKKLIAVPPTYDDGIMILDMQGKILFNLVSFQGKDLKGSVEWMSDNTLLFRVENNLYRTNPSFTQATLVKTFSFAEWGDFTPSADGSKIALRGGNHLWLMNIDGSDLRQITESKFLEVYPVFSPDGKYLLIGTNYRITGEYGHLWDLAIIPADGRKYNVDEGVDKNVIPFIVKGKTTTEAADGTMLWR